MVSLSLALLCGLSIIINNKVTTTRMIEIIAIKVLVIFDMIYFLVIL